MSRVLKIKDENGNFITVPYVNGVTPHIGDNGNWWIDEEDTGVSAFADGNYALPAAGEYQNIDTLFGSNKLIAQATTTRYTRVGDKVTACSSLAGYDALESNKIYYGTNFTNTSFNITLNGITKTIVFGPDDGVFNYEDPETGEMLEMSADAVTAAFQEKIDAAFGPNLIYVDFNAHTTYYRLIFENPYNSDTDLPIVLTSGGDESLNLTDALEILGIASGNTNILNIDRPINVIIKTRYTEIVVTLKEHTLTISTEATLREFLNIINDANIGVYIEYNLFKNSFVMTSLGEDLTMNITDDTGFFIKLGFRSPVTSVSEEVYIVDLITEEGKKIEDVILSRGGFNNYGVLTTLMITQKQTQKALDNALTELDKIKNAIIALGGTL